MRLSIVCLFKKSVNGHIFRGKDRLVKPVSKQAMATLRTEYERQERNMLLLRHPYLTPEESSGHTKGMQKRETLIAKWNLTQLQATMKPHVTIEERLNHLRVKESWD